MSVEFRLLQAFKETFTGKPCKHRDSTIGDTIAVHLYEDLFHLSGSAKFNARVVASTHVVNRRNTRPGVRSRRGDGTFGVLVPGSNASVESGFWVKRGPTAIIEIGIEVKILFKAMIKQIDRVASDLRGQAEHFERGGDTPIKIGIAGVNFAAECTSYEGSRTFATDGRTHKHPIQEAQSAIERLRSDAVGHFDHFLFLRFRASNVPPYSFEWVDIEATKTDYAAILARIVRDYDRKF